MGYIASELIGKPPGLSLSPVVLKVADISYGLAALSKVLAIGWAQIFGYMSLCDITGFKVCVAFGRLAKTVIVGMFIQDGLTGSVWGDRALYMDSSVRALENDLGVQASLGLWDPIAYTADDSVENSKCKHQIESSMPATMFTDVPNGLSTLFKVPVLGWCQIVAFTGLIELNAYNEQINGELGNYGAGFLGAQFIGL